MQTTTSPRTTIEQIIATYGDTIASLTRATDIDPADGPEFLALLEEARDALNPRSNIQAHDTVRELDAAATYLADALSLALDNPIRAVLLCLADDHLGEANTTA